MARIEYKTKQLIKNGVREITRRFDLVQQGLQELDDFTAKYGHIGFDSAKITALKTEIKTKGKDNFEDGLRFALWIAGKVQGITVPAAFTDAEVDALDKNIRTFDEDE